MTAQLPVEVRQQVKDCINAKMGDFVEGDGALFAVKEKNNFGERILLAQGYLDRGHEKVTVGDLFN